MRIAEFQGEYRFLSNFWPAQVTLDNVVYPSVECAYQAAKTLILVDRKPFTCMNAGQAKRAGKSLIIRPDWNQVKLAIMANLVKQKFNNNVELRVKLLNTGNDELVEGNRWNDTFWGICNGKGTNHLGKIIMDVRSQL
jgi:ribA/ribD-fused uncharacterized protein